MAAGSAKSNSRPPRRKKPPYQHQHNSSTRSCAAPSAGLLSLLATIAGFQPADASPLTPEQHSPPSFLCPFIDQEDIDVTFADTIKLPVNIAERGPGRSRLAPATINSNVKRHNVPDKYEQGDDGRWRKVNKYTLYGSTVCKEDCDPGTTTSIVDETVVPTVSHSSAISATPTKDVLDALPSGWQPSNKVTGGRTTIILALSLVLAFFICGMMIGCIFWRRKRRRSREDPDLEMKLRKRRRETQEETNSVIDKENRVKAKIWARATARWKANARARQRDRRRHMARGTLSPPSSVSLQESPDNRDTSSVVASRAASRSSFQLPSISPSQGMSNPSVLSLAEAPSPRDEAETPTPSTLDPLEHSDPPAYHQRQSLPDIHIISEPCDNPGHNPNDSPSKCELHEHSSSSNISHTERPSLTEDRIPYSPSIDVAHVATDDKTLLARMADLASAPPNANSDIDEGQSSSRGVSAPVWHDEDLGDFPVATRANDSYLLPCTPPRSCTPSPFPPPPSKGKMSEFYGYPYSLDELGSDAEPSAPPFEEHITAPVVGPCDDPDIAPSAPPLEDSQYGDDEIWPSAPEGDGPSLDRDPVSDRAGVNLHDHDREEDTSHPPPSSSGSNLSPALPGDGIPPIYHP